MNSRAPSKPAAFQVSRDATGRLQLIDGEGIRHGRVRVKRMFPITDPDHWIALRDPKGCNLAEIESLDDLRDDQRALICDELAQTEFLPRIERIVEIRRRGEALDWHALTDRGRTRFRLPNSEAIRLFGPSGLLITDEHGIRYIVPEVAALDAGSRRKLEWCMF